MHCPIRYPKIQSVFVIFFHMHIKVQQLLCSTIFLLGGGKFQRKLWTSIQMRDYFGTSIIGRAGFPFPTPDDLRYISTISLEIGRSCFQSSAHWLYWGQKTQTIRGNQNSGPPWGNLMTFHE
jgi:hypothetical protein